MKKFCSIVHNDYPGDPRIKKQCEALVSAGYLVTIICIKKDSEDNYEEINGVRVYRLNIHKKRSSKLRYLFDYFRFFLVSFIRLNLLDIKYKFSVIQVNNLPDFLVFITVVQKLRGAKIILDMHEIMPEFFMSKYKKCENSKSIKLLKLIEKMSLKFADEIITIDEPIKQIFKQRSIPDKNVTIIMNTIDESIVPYTSKQRNHNFSLVYHGQLLEIYGLDIVIMALNEFYKTCKDFKFYIYGRGPQEESLKLLINKLGLSKYIFLMGSIPYQELMKQLTSMNIGIIPARKDVFLDLSFSNKLGEYIYLKIPVIHSNLNSIQYYFSSDEITYFSSGDPVDLNKKISFAYKNPYSMINMAEKAFEKYQTLKWSVMAKRYTDLLDSLILPTKQHDPKKDLLYRWSKTTIH